MQSGLVRQEKSAIQRIDIKVGFKCNNRCKFCVQGSKRSRYPDKATSEIKAILRDSKGRNTEIVFTGGECTIRPDILELVSYSKGLGHNVHVQTNGRMFAYKDFCRKIKDAGAQAFTIAIHGHNPRLHDYLTGAKGAFEQVSGGIRNLLALGCFVSTNTVIPQGRTIDSCRRSPIS